VQVDRGVADEAVTRGVLAAAEDVAGGLDGGADVDGGVLLVGVVAVTTLLGGAGGLVTSATPSPAVPQAATAETMAPAASSPAARCAR
jgi:hypothetical protein